MDGKRIYQIQINGVQESINAVNSLNKQLDALESKINALQSKNVNINAGGGSKSSSTSSLSEEEKIARQIEQIDAKRIAYSKEIYQNYLAAKDVLKETVKDQQQIAATERLQADNYTNTMAGMKQELADIKSVMQTVDLGDTDQFDKMTQRAKELNDKLKEIEQSYGQFGRNVGNYANGVAEGLAKIKVNVGGTVREFDNARQASKILNNELKAMAMNGQQDTKAFKDLRQAVLQMESTMNDAKKPMDNLMDTMESFTAVASISKGFSAFFGVDDTKIQQNIQKLLALQTALKGLQTISKQMQTREGLGLIFGTFSTQVDKATAKLLVFNRALLGTSKAAKVAAVGVKTLGKAIKGVASLGILLAIDLAIEGLEELWNWFNKVDEAAEREKETQKELAQVYGEASGKLMQYKTKVDNFNGSKKEEKKLVEELNKEFGSTLGTYKSLSQWQDVLKKKGDAYIQTLVNQAKAQDALNEVTAAYINLETVKQKIANGDYSHWYQSQQQDAEAAARAEEEANQRIAKAEENLKKIVTENEEYIKKHGLGNYAPTIKKNGEKSAKAVDEAEKDLISLRIANMKEGLNKVLKQLEEERKQRLAKVIADGKLVGERQAEINKLYDKKVLDTKREWAENVQKTYREMWDNIYAYSLETQSKIASVTYQGSEIGAQNLEYKRSKKAKPENASYGVQGAKQLKDSTYSLLQLERQNNKDLAVTYSERLGENMKYWDERIAFETSAATANYEAQKALENEAFEQEKRDITNRLEEQRAINSDWVTKRKQEAEAEAKDEKWSKERLDLELNAIDKKYQEASDKTWELYEKNMEVAKKNHNIILEGLEQDKVNAIQNINAEYYRSSLQELRDFQTAIANLEDKQPVYDKVGWGIINISETKKNNENLLAAYSKLAVEITELKKELQIQLAKNEITFDDFQNANRELDAFAENVGQKIDKVVKDLNIASQIGSFIQSINQYVQAGLQAVQTVMSSLNDYQDYQFDKEQEMLDKENEMIEDALDKQQEIIEEHKSAIDSIEDELSSARGDRRQRLIDQLNAEVAAQRAAQKEKAKIEKQQEAQERKQEALEKKRKQAEYDRNLMSILVSNAMAAANAYATEPFIPVGLAMGSLAIALGAAQYAIAKAQKPYAKGGLLEGKSHREGGIPVGNTGIEVEGKEYVIRKKSTAPNLDILEYINKSERKLSLDDFIDFYTSGKAKKVFVSSSPARHFADGGSLPMLSNNYEFDDRLLNAFEKYAQRPSYVSVVDINTRQAAVKNIEVLAGLSE